MITTTNINRWITSLAALITFTMASATQADTLGEVLEKSGWNRILGTWVDKDSGGQSVELIYSWKFENTLVTLDARMGETKSSALIGINPKNDEVFHAGANSDGGTALGTWTIDEGDAILSLNLASVDGAEKEVVFRHHFENNDTITVTMQGDGNSGSFTLIRKK